MIPSRPKGVLYQGTPAYGYSPCGFRVSSIRRSDVERSSHSSKRPLDEPMRASWRFSASCSASLRRAASPYEGA